MNLPRGIRNNNPGNIEKGAGWKGRCKPDEIPHHEDRFVIFRRPEWGIRAIARVLRTYQVRHEIRTVRGIIQRWAPNPPDNPENPHQAEYIEFVSEWLSVGPDQEINVLNYQTARDLVVAITHFENRRVMPYTDDVIDFGLQLAGIKLPVRFYT